MDIELTPEVTAVTVYSQQARVTVRADTALEVGEHQLIFNDLPLALDTGSVRAGGSGTAQVRVHGVDVRRRHYEETPAANVRELEARIDGLEDELKAFLDGQEVLEAQGRYLEGLRGASEQFARGLALGRTSVEEQGRIGRFMQEQDEALRSKARELDRKKRDVSRMLDKSRRELEQVTSARPRERNQAAIDVEVLSPGEFRAELIYNVNRASWKPLYDVRLVQAEDGHELEVQAIAQISQSSGQDWPDVDLRVSTARTELNRRLPELKPWYVDVYQPPVVRAAPAPLKGAAAR
ncbi:MAG: mucoidy inhibitor MuiA family protein, partial [Chloroflexota bacterium]